jgi:hypothetical protein
MTGDIEATLERLLARGIDVADEPSDEGWGVLARIEVPGFGAARHVRAVPPGAALTLE